MSSKIVEIEILNNKYKVSCESKKEDHLLSLAGNLNKRVNSISQKTGGKSSDVLNFLLAALTLEDKVLELTEQLDSLHQKLEGYKDEKAMEYTGILNRVNKIIANLECIKD